MTTTTRFGMLVAMVVLAACGQQATLKELQVSPPVTEVTQNLTAPVSAVAVYSDGTQRDVTAEVQWSSQDAQVATAAGGLIQAGEQAGATVLTAAWSGLQSTARVDVVAATLVSLTVATEAAALPAGTTTRATASGLFSDGRTRDVTAAVQWQVAGAALSVDLAGTVRGEATGQGEVVAALAGQSASASVTVTDAVAVSVALQGVAATMPLGLTAPITVLATFTDGSVRDVTAEAGLEVLDPTVATVDASGTLRVLAAGAKELRGLTPGATELRASYAGLSAAAPVQITAAVLVSIAITPPHGAIKTGSLYDFSATGTYSNGDVLDLTLALTWSSADQELARVYRELGPNVLLARLPGTVAISATDPASGVSASIDWIISR